MNSLRITKMELGPIGTNAYLMWEDGGKDAVLIDAPPDYRETVESHLAKESLELKELWLTHGHWDHMAGASELLNDDISVVGHRADQMLFEKPEVMSTFAMPGMNFEPVSVTKWVDEGDVSEDHLSDPRADLPGGDFETLKHSIQMKVYNLPEDTEIFPGHGANTTVGAERRNNPFVRPL